MSPVSVASPSGRQRIDLATWERRHQFELFDSFEEPYHGVCVRVDCTGTFQFAKQHSLSVFLALVQRSLAAAQQVENFRIRAEDGAVWRYDRIHAGSAVGRPNGTIGFAHYRYLADLRSFVAEPLRIEDGCAVAPDRPGRLGRGGGGLGGGGAREAAHGPPAQAGLRPDPLLRVALVRLHVCLPRAAVCAPRLGAVHHLWQDHGIGGPAYDAALNPCAPCVGGRLARR